MYKHRILQDYVTDNFLARGSDFLQSRCEAAWQPVETPAAGCDAHREKGLVISVSVDGDINNVKRFAWTRCFLTETDVPIIRLIRRLIGYK